MKKVYGGTGVTPVQAAHRAAMTENKSTATDKSVRLTPPP